MGSISKGPSSVRAVAIAAAGATFLAVVVYLGSGGLANFDSSLIGYATATIFLAFGVTYRYVMWVQSPPTAGYFSRGWQAFFSWSNFRRFPTLIPKALFSYLGLQTFIAKRGKGRWLAHQSLFWGVVLASAVTFPLTFGWIRFSATAAGAYRLKVLGMRMMTFDPLSFFGWAVFHILDLAAVLVLAGCSYFVWRRFRDREATTGQRFGYDFLPLVALIAISVTGLLLTFSSVLLEGRDYDFLAILHMSVVVLTLVFIPFGKFFHVIQRPASIGVDTYKRTSIEREGVFNCVRCGEPLEAVAFVRDLEATMDELDLEFGPWIETCPRCKRLARGEAYLQDVKEGY